MRDTRKLLVRGLAVLVLLGIAVAMYIVGRGHTVYLDNKTLEYEGQSYPAYYRANVTVKDEVVAKLEKRDRGMATTMGQTFLMQVETLMERGAEPVVQDYRITLPFHTDGIVVNIPGLLAGLPEAAYLGEFTPIVEEPAEEEVAPADEFDITTFDAG